MNEKMKASYNILYCIWTFSTKLNDIVENVYAQVTKEFSISFLPFILIFQLYIYIV